MRVDFEGWTPPHVSHSTIDGYATCGMRTKLQKVYQLEQHPMYAGTGGNAVHTGTELYDQGDERDPQALFLEGWEKAVEKNKEYSPNFPVEDYILTGKAAVKYGGKRNFEWWMDNGPLMVQRWIDWRRDNPDWHIWEDPDGVPAIELKLSYTLPNGIVVLGYIDRVMVTPAGQLAPVDIKTGRSPETAEQLGGYRVGMLLTFGEMFAPDWGYWWDAAKGQHSSPLDLTMYTPDYIGERYAEAISGINAGCFLAKPANNCKAWCGVSRFCSAVGGTPVSQV